jgi:hypothetical protein
MRFAASVLPLLMAALWGADPAQAADRAAAQACRADYKKLCSGVKPGDGRGAQCLKQHEAELSDGCKTAMAGAARCVEKVRQVCGAADAGARQACIKEHAAELGDCKNAG